MQGENYAVGLLLDRLQKDGLEWFLKAKEEVGDFFEDRLGGSFSALDQGEAFAIGPKPSGKFPANKILVVRPPGHEADEMQGLWVKWDFTTTAKELRLVMSHWYRIRRDNVFVAFRYETPETGVDHNYFHCQPCRNYGTREGDMENAILISERYPTIPVNASNIVELAICALMAGMGRQRAKDFVARLRLESEAEDNSALRAASEAIFG